MISPSSQCRTYRLVLRGELGDHFAALFPEMRLERAAGTTTLVGTVTDQAQLQGLIGRTQDLGLELISVTQTDQPSRETHGGQRKGGSCA